MAFKADDVASRVVEIVEAGRVTQAQRDLLDKLKYELGLIKEPTCKHTNGYFSNDQDVFTCKDCGVEVDRP